MKTRISNTLPWLALVLVCALITGCIHRDIVITAQPKPTSVHAVGTLADSTDLVAMKSAPVYTGLAMLRLDVKSLLTDDRIPVETAERYQALADQIRGRLDEAVTFNRLGEIGHLADDLKQLRWEVDSL